MFAELLEQNKKALVLYEKYVKTAKLSPEESRSILISRAKIQRKQGQWDLFAGTYRQLMREAKNSQDKLGYLAEMARQMDRNDNPPFSATDAPRK